MPTPGSRACIVVPLLLWLLAASPPAAAVDGEAGARLYRTREEQREVGSSRPITRWLMASGLIELEWLDEHLASRTDAAGVDARSSDISVQLGLTASPLAYATAEVILEYDTEVDGMRLDEAVLSVEAGAFELELGRLYLPFGVYFSRLASGPVLEFAETRDTAGKLSYGPDDRFDLSLSVYRGRARERGPDPKRWDWTVALEVLAWGGLAVGGSYQSDLADALSRPLADHADRYERRVPAFSAYLSWLGERVDFSVEALAATRSLRELQVDRDQPLAWNGEVAYLASPRLELALRIEGSRELPGEPRYRAGAGVTWRAGRTSSVTLEYLHGWFDDDLAPDDEEQAYTHSDVFGVLVSVAF